MESPAQKVRLQAIPEGHDLSDILFDPKVFQIEDDEGTKDVSFASLLLGFTQNALETGTQTLQRVRDEQARVLAKVQWMYQVTFAAGVISFIAAVYKGFTADNMSQAWPSLIFGGLSGAVFVTIFIVRPAEAIERANVASVWINLAMNSYWIRMALSLQSDAALQSGAQDRRLEDATDDVLRSLRELLMLSDKSDERLTKILQPQPEAPAKPSTPPSTAAAPPNPTPNGDGHEG
jgi:hypothetical protein